MSPAQACTSLLPSAPTLRCGLGWSQGGCQTRQNPDVGPCRRVSSARPQACCLGVLCYPAMWWPELTDTPPTLTSS